MRIEAGKTPEWWLYRIYDRFDGKPLHDVVIADTEKMEITVWQRDKNGNVVKKDDNICVVTRRCWCRIIKIKPEDHY